MLNVNNLTKKFGNKVAVDNISFSLRPGKVTGFLGPNGAGKTTTMRCVLGLNKPDSGQIHIDHHRYNQLPNPLATVGAMIDAKAFHKSRSAYAHLQYIAAAAGFPKKRVDECLEIVGISSVAKKNAGGFSLGMAQRIGIAAALLGDPKLLILDEPVNGLDPEGVKWVRDYCREFAANGGTVLISSHLMSEVEQTVDDLIIIGRGKIIKTGTVKDVIDATSEDIVEIASTDDAKLQNLLFNAALKFERNSSGKFEVHNILPIQLGQLALQNHIVLTHLAGVKNSLEESFMKLTNDAVEYHAHLRDEKAVDSEVMNV